MAFAGNRSIRAKVISPETIVMSPEILDKSPEILLKSACNISRMRRNKRGNCVTYLVL